MPEQEIGAIEEGGELEYLGQTGSSALMKSMGKMIVALAAALPLFVCLACCNDAGRFSHAARYVPLKSEPAASQRTEFRLAGARVEKDYWNRLAVSATGIVMAYEDVAEERVLVLQQRKTLDQNRCPSDHDPTEVYVPPESVCRVTVSERRFPFIRVLLGQLAFQEKAKVVPGVLLRVYGHVEYRQGEPQIRVSLYRMWPPGEFLINSGLAALAEFN